MDFLNFKFVTDLTVTRVELLHRAKFRWNRWNCGRDMAIFAFVQNGGRRHLGFLKLQNSNCGTDHKCRIASTCQISWRWVKPLPRYLDVTFFKMAAAAILDFWNFKFLTIGTVQKDELRHCGKLCPNRLNQGDDISIFEFFKMAATAVLDFQNFEFLTVSAVKMVEVHHRAKFRQNRLNRAWYGNFFDF